jgi:hypothetical protein
MKSKRVFVLVRNAEESDFTEIDVFQSVHATRKGAEKQKAMWEADFDFPYQVLEREIED